MSCRAREQPTPRLCLSAKKYPGLSQAHSHHRWKRLQESVRPAEIHPRSRLHSKQQVAAARLTLQKDISSEFSVTYSTNLFTATQQQLILLNYQLTDQIQITASRDELSRYGVDLLVTKTFE